MNFRVTLTWTQILPLPYNKYIFPDFTPFSLENESINIYHER